MCAALAQTAGSFVPSSGAVRHEQARCPAGSVLAAGQPIYFDAATSTWKLADADVASAAADVQAVAGCSAGIGQLCDPIISDPNCAHGLTGVTAGDTIWNYTTAGTYTKTIGDLITGVFTTVVMVATSATNAKLSITRSGVAHA